MVPEHGRGLLFFTFLPCVVFEAVQGPPPRPVLVVLTGRWAAAGVKSGRCGWCFLLHVYAYLETRVLDRLVGLMDEGFRRN